MCKTENAKRLMDYMIVADSRVDIFSRFNVEVLMEIMFMAVLKEYEGKGIGINLCKYSVELARNLKHGIDLEKFLSPGVNPPQLVAVLWTGRGSQKIGHKLGFDIIFQEPFSNFTFRGETFAERVGDPTLDNHVSVKQI